MSYTDEFWKALEEEEKKRKKKIAVQSSEPKLTDDDIAPVRTVTVGGNSVDIDSLPTNNRVTRALRDKAEGNTWFKSGSLFDDGYDFGDVTRTILGTAGDAVQDAVTGIVGIGEDLLDAGMTLAPYIAQGQYYANGGGYNLQATQAFEQGISQMKEGSAEFVQEKLYDEEEITKKYLLPYDVEDESVLGGKSDALAQSAGQLGADLAMNYLLPGSGMVMMGATALGSESENALNNGATLDEAALSGIISAGAEVLTEQLSGGIKFGGKALDDGLTSVIASNISDRFVRSLAKFGVNAIGEGAEEWITEDISRFGQWLTYRNEEELSEVLFSPEAMQEKIDAFVGGAILGGGSNVIQSVHSNAKGKDSVTGNTKNEQAVIDKVFNDRIAEAGKDGKKLSGKEKTELYDKVVRDMERGYIGTDIIEEVLGEDAKNIAKNDRLVESYIEKGRAFEDFQADFDKYKGTKHEDAAKTTLENALRYRDEKGIGLNNTNRVHDFVDWLAQVSADTGITFDLQTDQMVKDAFIASHTQKIAELEGIQNRTAEQNKLLADMKAQLAKVQSGELIINGNNTANRVSLNLDSENALNVVVGHEVTHSVEKAKSYAKMEEFILSYAKTKGVDIDSRLKAIEAKYAGEEGTSPKSELVADLVGEYLFTDSDFVRSLTTQDRNLAQRIYDRIKYLYKIATAGSKEARELERVKKAFEDAYREAEQNREAGENTETKYSISETADGRFVAVVDNDILSNIDTSSWDDTKKAEAKKAASDALKQFSAGIVVDGITRKVNKVSRREYTRSNYTESLYNNNPEVFADKMRAADVADDIVIVATDWQSDGGLKHPRIDNFVDFDHGNTLIASGNAKYSAEVVVGITDTGEAVFYDVVDMTPATFDIKKEESPTTATTQNAIGDIQGDSSADNVAQKDGNVKKQYSLSDNQGKTLYTGSPVTDIKQFKVGGANGAKQTGDRYGRGIYLTTNKTTAQGYAGNSGRVYEINADDLNIFNLNDSITEEMKATLARELNGQDKQFRNSILRSFRSEKAFTDFESAEKFFDEQRKVWKQEDGYYSANKPEIKSADDKTGKAVIEYTDFANIENAIGNLTGNQLYDALKSISTDDFASFITGHGFDGIAFDENADNQQYVIYRNEDRLHIMNDGDVAPTKFSLSNAVEQTKNLVALHNLTADKLTKSLELGGLPMPSLAITKADIPHSNFGEITLIFGKETIDPKANKKNKVYSADAWTPTFPNVEYEADSKVVDSVSKKLRDLGKLVDEVFQRDLSRIGYSIEDYLNRQGGEEGLIQYVMDNYGLKAAYLEDTGKHIDPVTKQEEVPRNFNPNSADKYEKVMDILGVSTVEEVWDVDLKEARDNHGTELEEVFPGITQSALRMGKVLGMVGSYLKGKDSAPEYKTVIDSAATNKAVNDAIDAEGFEAWTRNLFSGVVKDSGIYNNKDLFTPSGNLRSFKQTHLPVTLENIVKAMASQNDGNSKNVSGFNGVKTLRAATAETFKSIDAMHDREGRLQHLTQEQADEITDALQSRLSNIINAIDNENAQKGDRNPYIRYDQIGQAISEIGEGGKYNVADIQRVFSEYGRTVSDDTALEVKQLLYDVSQMPVNIFEAKPQRVVGFDEAKVFVIPRNADVKLKQELLNRGYSIAEYDPDVEGDRQKVVNQFEEYKFSLSTPGEDIAPIGNFNVYGRDLKKLSADDIAPIDDDIAPIREDVNPSVENVDTAETNVVDEHPVAEGKVTSVPPVAENKDAESLAGDRDSFVSQKAMELYEEITSLKKGVRASKRLGYLLDHGHEWRSIKTALLNIRDNPNQVVNPNSAAETVAREMLGREYDEMVYELAEQSDVAESVRTKMQHIQTEIANNERLREQSNMDYDSEIADVQAEYDAKKNKNTIVANDLLRRIERLKRMKSTNDDRYTKRISDLEARLEKMRKPEYKRAVQRRTKQDEYTNLMKSLVGDTTTWVDKKLGISYKVNTLRRNLRDVVRDASGKRDIAKADAIYDELQGKYNHNEAELKRESSRIKKVFADLNLNHTEDTYAHMLGEFRHNPDSKLTEETVKEFYEKNKGKIDTKKVDKAIEESRKVFDDLIVRVNERLKEQGMKEIPYRQGYFPHFTNPKQGWLAKLLNWKTVDTEIPTSIAGLTETFNPERSWQGFSKQRKGDTTDYSLAQGLDTYIHGALDWIYHIEDIQKRRALENHIRYIHSEEGVKARIDAINKSEELDADEAQSQIDAVYAEANNPLNNFVTNLRAGTNTLANKKSENDRQMESDTNRKIYSVMTNLNNRISANMVVGSFSSALTNFIPITQSWMEVSPVYSLRGMKDTIKSTIRDDGIVNKSDFLTNRLLNEENLYQTAWDKAADKAAFFMEAIDSFTSQTVWRSKYLQNISDGMSETEAIKNADQFAENVIAGRSRGNMPTIFDAKNPFTKIFTAFQLEVNNQYGYMFKDAPQDSKNKARLIKGYATAFLGAYAYNALYSSLVGRDAAFDPISILEDLFRDMGLFGDDDEEEEPKDVLLNLRDNILEEVPFVGGLMGGGRIPISSALPYSGEYEGLEAFLTDVSEGNAENFWNEVFGSLSYIALPFGGGQIKKTVEGLSMFSDDHPVAGSYTKSGNLRFPVEDTLGNRIQAGLFGQYASENARDYFDNGRSPLKEKQIQEYIDVDIPIRDYWEYREGLADQKTIEDKFDYIAGLDLPVSKKNILINNLVDREEKVDLDGYEDFSSYEEFDFATKNPGKYAVSQAVGNYSAYAGYMDAIGDIEADKDENGKSISGSKKEKVFNYIDSLPLDVGQKMILFKSMYDSKEDRNAYNAAIVEYLDSRDDISYEEMVTILTELGMRVEGNNVYWD